MAYTGFKKPNNKIVAAGEPLVQELKVETATNMYPGRLVKKGTNDDDIVVNTANGAAVGWLGYEQTNPQYKPANVDTAYSAGDYVAVLNGGGFVIVGRLASGQSVDKGDKLEAAANGELTALSSGTMVAIAEETVDASAAAKDIMVRSLI